MKRIINICIIAAVCLAMFGALTPLLSPASAAALKAPASFSCADRTYNSVTVKWSKVGKAKSYVVYMCAPGATSYKKVKTVKGVNSVNCKITGLKSQNVYKFRVRACTTARGTGAGALSKEVSVKTLGPETYTISASTGPLNKKMLRYSYYNKYTKTYYVLRSYMERFEKCGGGTLVLKAGTYSVTNTVFIPSNVTIVLQDGVVIKKGTNTHLSGLKSSNSLFHFIKPSKGQSKKVYGKYDGMKNISLLGEGTAIIDMSNQTNCNCIEAGHNQNVTIQGIIFRNVSGGHFLEMDANKNAVITDCTFLNIKDTKNVREAINLDTPDTVTGGFTAAWSKMDKTANANILIENCIFKNMPRAIGTHNYSYGHPHKNITIRNCRISEVSSFGIGMMYWQNSEISGCSITGKYKNGNQIFDGILGYGLTGVQICDNVLVNFRFPVLLKDYQDSNHPQYKKIYNAISENDIQMMGNNVGDGLANEFVDVESNNGKTIYRKVPITMLQDAASAQGEIDAEIDAETFEEPVQ